MLEGVASLRLVRVGCVAARALREDAGGSVNAVFERSFYCTLGDQWICVGPPSLGDGPLNAICVRSTPPAHSRKSGNPVGLGKELGPRFRGDERGDGILCAIGDAARVEGRVLRIAAIAIGLDGATEWRPAALRGFDRRSLACGLAAFAHALPPDLPAEGVALLVGPSDDAWPPVAAAARAPAWHLALLVGSGADAAADVAPLVALIGLGPGLTPSGDDFLGGAMVALRRLGLVALSDAIWAELSPQLAARTNDISRAHLAAAAEGFGSAALHALIEDVLAANAEALSGRIAALATIGHTSGWDALAGAITVLRAAVD